MTNVTKIIGNIQTKLQQRAWMRREENIKKYFNLHDAYGEAANQMYNAREGIANFAKEKGVTINVTNYNPNLTAGSGKDTFGDDICLQVTNPKTKKESRLYILSSDTRKIYPNVEEKEVLIPGSGERLGKIAIGKFYTEDTFLRHLYRNIEKMIKFVTKP